MKLLLFCALLVLLAVNLWSSNVEAACSDITPQNVYNELKKTPAGRNAIAAFPPVETAPHSIRKRLALEKTLVGFIRESGARTLAFVDVFAGLGAHKHGTSVALGSPLVAMRACCDAGITCDLYVGEQNADLLGHLTSTITAASTVSGYTHYTVSTFDRNSNFKIFSLKAHELAAADALYYNLDPWSYSEAQLNAAVEMLTKLTVYPKPWMGMINAFGAYKWKPEDTDLKAVHGDVVDLIQPDLQCPVGTIINFCELASPFNHATQCSRPYPIMKGQETIGLSFYVTWNWEKFRRISFNPWLNDNPLDNVKDSGHNNVVATVTLLELRLRSKLNLPLQPTA